MITISTNIEGCYRWYEKLIFKSNIKLKVLKAWKWFVWIIDRPSRITYYLPTKKEVAEYIAKVMIQSKPIWKGLS